MKNKQQEIAAPSLELVKSSGPWRNFGLLAAALMLTFSVPLYQLVRFAAGSELYSYILLIPFASAYLAWAQWRKLPPFSGPARLLAAIFSLVGLAALAVYALAGHAGLPLTEEDYLAGMGAACWCFFMGGSYYFLGKETVRALAFPIGLLVFMVPLPTFLLSGVEWFLQQGSALAAEGFFELSGATFLRDGLVFQLPTITLQVAPECSGIHSTLVLLITSMVAGHLFLRSPWKRTLLILAVIPLALLRNGFRVFVLGELCTHVGPEMIDSPIHHRGGPLFFGLSLIPFFLFLFFLWRSEQSDKNLKLDK